MTTPIASPLYGKTVSSSLGKVLMIVGTRPEAIKMAPVARALAEIPGLQPLLCVTGQQRQMLDQVLDMFQWTPDFDLDLMHTHQSLTDVTTRVMQGVSKVLSETQPAAVVVQGDTATTLAAALAAFNARIPVAHVEAGLRSGDVQNPFPEEAYRRMVTELATWHFPPTEQAHQHLLRSGIPPNRVFLTGNTVVDAMHHMLRSPACCTPPQIANVDWDRHIVVMATAHRRENWTRMEEICDGLRRVAVLDPSIRIIFPVHPNRVIRDVVYRELQDIPGIALLEPQTYPEFLACLSRTRLVLTDSGGVQEEATSLGKPLVILREATERPEVLSCGLGVLAGTDPSAIAAAAEAWLKRQPPRTHGNVFGDGYAAKRIAQVIAEALLPNQSRLEERSSLSDITEAQTVKA
ncbi:non-hydrolyzing UDP-N-acetylglucosamine 2-epimerase [Terriglobus albidus]|uniref:non-hydrolyzing UDP-N-acetylglucosamine 2-epimerase n=1 Tax=Terriglobus albidus TaxID=1592106 RepID=UPI0021DF870B|nr:UDP-N-acetylglucosamine 2-epimerase (non-hydrolyzing) [Terriglobus albidus]